MISKQTNLFREENEIRSALFSEDRRYRYWLLRKWHKDLPLIMFIGLNPSTADETQNDPTIRRVIKFAKNWGYGGVYMCNLFAYVSTDPKKLVTSGEDVSQNDIALQVCKFKCKDVLFAWGAFKEAKERADRVIRMFPEALCLKLNQNGSPIHPLYVPGNITPKKYSRNERAEPNNSRPHVPGLEALSDRPGSGNEGPGGGRPDSLVEAPEQMQEQR